MKNSLKTKVNNFRSNFRWKKFLFTASFYSQKWQKNTILDFKIQKTTQLDIGPIVLNICMALTVWGPYYGPIKMKMKTHKSSWFSFVGGQPGLIPRCYFFLYHFKTSLLIRNFQNSEKNLKTFFAWMFYIDLEYVGLSKILWWIGANLNESSICAYPDKKLP